MALANNNLVTRKIRAACPSIGVKMQDRKVKLVIIRLLLLSLFLPLFGTIVRADVRLPDIFSSNMVLQRDQPVKLWGWADPREKIELLLGPKTYRFRADREGRWEIEIGPKPAGGPYDIIILGKTTFPGLTCREGPGKHLIFQSKAPFINWPGNLGLILGGKQVSLSA